MRVVLLTAHAALARRIHLAADGQLLLLPPAPLPREPAQLLTQLGGHPLPEVLVLGPDVDLESAFALATRFDQTSPGTSVVLVNDEGGDVWLAAMRAGVRDILGADAGVPDVRMVLDRASQVALGRRHSLGSTTSAPRSAGRVIVVTSPKGGSGKTTIATNIAVGLAATAPKETVLVDLDVQFGDVASALALHPEHCLADSVHGPAAVDTMALKTMLTPHPSELYVLCGSDSPAAGDSVTGEQVSVLLQQLAREFRYVVVDTSPGLSEHTLAALDWASDAVLVCSMDVPSVRGMRKELELLGELSFNTMNTHMVLNLAERRGGLTVPDVQRTIGMNADVVIPRSKAVLLSTNQGVPLLQNGTRDSAAKSLRRIIERITAAPDSAGKHAWANQPAGVAR